MAPKLAMRDRTEAADGRPLRLEAPSRDRRRKMSWVAAGLVVVLLSALAGAVLLARVADRAPVLALATSVERGQTLTVDDLRVVRVAADGDVALLGADRRDEIVGLRAANAMPAGSLLSRGDLADGPQVPEGWSVVGLALQPGAYPTADLRSGDRVMVVATSDGTALQDVASVTVLSEDAVVVAAGPVSEVTSGLLVTVSVPEAVAAEIAAAGMRGEVALVGTGPR